MSGLSQFWHQLVQMENYKGHITQQGARLVKTYSQMGHVTPGHAPVEAAREQQKRVSTHTEVTLSWTPAEGGVVCDTWDAMEKGEV